MATPFRLHLEVQVGSGLYRDGLYALRFSLESAPDQAVQTRFTPCLNGCTLWNESITLPAMQKSSISIQWELLHRPSTTPSTSSSLLSTAIGGQKEVDKGDSQVCKAELTLIPSALDVEEKRSISGNNKLAIFDSFCFDLSLKLTRNQQAIAIVRSPSQHPNEHDSMKYGVLYHAFIKIMEHKYFPALSEDLVRDCVQDANNLVEAFVVRSQSENLQAMERYYRNYLKLQNGSKYFFAENCCLKCYPIEENSLQINLSTDDQKYILLIASNRFAMWTWSKWLRIAYTFWKSPEHNLPSWAEGRIFSSQAQVLTSEGVGYNERVVLNLDNPFTLKVGKEILKLKDMSSMILSADSILTEDSVIDIEIAYLDTDASWDNQAQESSSEKNGPAGWRRRAPLLSRWKLAKRMVVGASTIASGASEALYGAAVGVVKVARRGSKGTKGGEPTHGLNIDRAKEVGANFQSIGDVDEMLPGSCTHYLVMKTEGGSFVLNNDQRGWSGKLFLENTMQSKQQFDHAIVSSSLKYFPDKFVEHCRRKPSISALLFKRGHQLAGERYLSMSKLQQIVNNPVRESPLQAADYMQEVPSSHRCEVNIPFDTAIGLLVTLKDCKHLKFPRALVEQEKRNLSLFAKCKLVDCNGHSHNKALYQGSTAAVSVSDNPNWGDTSFTFRSKDGIDNMEYVRVEIFIAWGPKLALHQSLGAAFIPISMFTSKQEIFEFPVVNFRRNKVLMAEEDPDNVSTLMVAIKRIEEAGDYPFCSVRLAISSVYSPISKTMWMAEAVPTNAEDINTIHSEHCSVQLGFVNMLVEIQEEEVVDCIERHYDEDWRQLLQRSHPHYILSTCCEMTVEYATATIPYSRVQGCSLVSTSILCVDITIGRYLISDKGGHKFEDATIQIFISNCNASALKACLEERIFVCTIRSKLYEVMLEGKIEERVTIAGNDINSSVPETEDLSSATWLFCEIDTQCMELERRLRLLDEISTQQSTLALGRVCRLRLYMAALFGVGLKGVHDFQESEVRSIMEADFRKAMNINLDNEVATANNRIEYLLDMAEKRIRDAALCGWNYRGGELEKCLEIFANGYFIEIVSLLGAFFEDKGQSNVKGLTSKVELINTYMKHNDRLDMIIESALRPYGLKANPPAKLSLFLDFNLLLSWYTSVLTMEMRSRVDDVLDVWRDVQKDVTGQASLYKFPLPWIPQRLHADSGNFFTNILEDLVEVLTTYLSYARMKKENIAPSFHCFMGRLDTKMCVAYSNAFLYLADSYKESLKMKDWLKIKEDDELSEYVTWLCSVANDSARARNITIPESEYVALDETSISSDSRREEDTLVKSSMQEVVKSFKDVRLQSLHQLSGVIFREIFFEREVLLGSALVEVWHKSVLEADSTPIPSVRSSSKTHLEPEDRIDVIANISRDVLAYVEEIRDFLHDETLHYLIFICVDKLLVFMLTLMRLLRSRRIVITSNEMLHQQLLADISAMQNVARSMSTMTNTSDDFAAYVVDRSKLLASAMILLDEDFLSQDFVTEVKNLQSITKSDPSRAYSIFKFLECCLALRGVRKCMSKHRRVDVSFSKSSASSKVEPIALSATSTTEKVVSSTFGLMQTFGNLLHITSSKPSAASSIPTQLAATSVDQIQGQVPLATHDVDEFDSEVHDLKDEVGLEWVMSVMEKMKTLAEEQEKVASSEENKKSSSRSVLDWEYQHCETFVFKKDKSKRSSLGKILLHANIQNAQSKQNIFDEVSTDIGVAIASAFPKFRKWQHNKHHKTLVRTESYCRSHSSSNAVKTVRQTIVLYDLCIMGSLQMLNLSSPSFYLKFQLGDEHTKTKTVDQLSDQEAFNFPDRVELHYRQLYSEMMTFTVSLWQAGVVMDELIATTSIQFMAFSPPSFSSKTVPFSQWSRSFRVLRAVRQTLDANKRLPEVVMSMSVLGFDM